MPTENYEMDETKTKQNKKLCVCKDVDLDLLLQYAKRGKLSFLNLGLIARQVNNFVNSFKCEDIDRFQSLQHQEAWQQDALSLKMQHSSEGTWRKDLSNNENTTQGIRSKGA